MAEKNLMQRALDEIRDLRGKLLQAERAAEEPIAIVGIGCRFPGGANSPGLFRDLLNQGFDAIGPVPPDRWNIDEYYDPDPTAAGKMYVREGGFLDRVDGFDAQFFGISPREADWIDPQQRLLMEVCWEALEDAGCAPASLTGKSAGVFAGISSFNYATHILGSFEPGEVGQFFGTGNALSVAAGRVSYTLGLTGPSLVIDTACSSSLVALHLACESLRRGECEVALAGGVGLILTPDTTVNFCRAGMLAKDARCKTFSAAADGYVRGEGAGMVLLKRLPDAVAARDRVIAVVRGSACNHDGRSTGLTVPSRNAQREAIRAALARAGAAPAQFAYLEAHGTGTSLGDPIELGALADVFGAQELLVGSVKTNLGHLEAAAGIAGVIKVALSMEQGSIPGNLHFSGPNPLFDWQSHGLRVPVAQTMWPADRTFAGVSSFGFSGTNAHVVMERYAPVPEQATALERPLHIRVLSAKSQVALDELAARHGPLSDASSCFTANTGRNHFEHRTAVVTGCAPIRGHADSEPRCAFLFTGQGSQYAGMGGELYRTDPDFRQTLDQCDEVLRTEFGVPLLDLLYTPTPQSADEALKETAVSQPVLFALEYALAQLWRSWGVEPVAVMGHSLGEYTAACVAGVLDWKSALRLVAVRGRLMGGLPRDGEMAAVLAPFDAVEALIREYRKDVSIAARNGPRNTVISGRRGAMREVVARAEQAGFAVRPLAVSHAFHSPLMDPILREFEETANRVAMNVPSLTLISNVTGAPFAGSEVPDGAYWRCHVRQPVDFEGGLRSLRSLGINTLIEIGPGVTLSAMARQVLSADSAFLPSLRQGEADWKTVLQSLGAFYIRGGNVDWEAFDRPWPRRKVSLPTYPFERQRCWVGLGSRQKAPGNPRLLYEVEWRPVERSVNVSAPVHVFVGNDEESPADQCAKLVALVRRGLEGRLWIVTRGARTSLAQAALHGLAKTIGIEHPDIFGGAIDIESGDIESGNPFELAAHAPAGEKQLAFRGGQWFAPRLRAAEETSPAKPLARDATYLITGGLGAIGLQVARALAQHGATQLVLVSRSMPSSAELPIRQLREQGVSIVVETADAADRTTLGALLSRIGGLRGIVHAAGVLEDAVVTNISKAQLERVFRPKGDAASALHELTTHLPLDFFVLCSSAASVLGAGGQGAYAAANAALDALAHHRRAQGLPAVVFNFGPWAGSGMGTSARKAADVRAMDPEVGAALLVRNRNAAQTQLVAIAADIEKINQTSQSAPAELACIPSENKLEFLTQWVRNKVGLVLGLAPNSMPPLKQGFFDMGFDSLLAVELRNVIQSQFPVPLPVTLTFEHATVLDLANYLAGALPAPPEESAPAEWNDELLDELRLLEELLVRN
jgi:acyl transferase domain-containing protein